MITNKHVLITGGGTGIGRTIALLFADEGAKVTITGRRSRVLEEVADKRVNISLKGMRVSSVIVSNVFGKNSPSKESISTK